MEAVEVAKAQAESEIAASIQELAEYFSVRALLRDTWSYFGVLLDDIFGHADEIRAAVAFYD